MFKVFLVVFVVYVTGIDLSVSKPFEGVEQSGLNGAPPTIVDWIKHYGYPCETHEIETEDGYLLTYHRVPHGKAGNGSMPRPAVLVLHGVFAVSGIWVTLPDSIGLMLADAGYDVWLGNARGNTYSRKHIKYDPDKDRKKFWDFSWHEMGYYDLPAGIDYILQVTGQTELNYVGHSMGTTMYFVLGATRPEFMPKVKVAALMAPVAHLHRTNVRSPVILLLCLFHKYISMAADLFKIYELFPYSLSGYETTKFFCSQTSLFQFVCEDFLFIAAGFDRGEVDKSNLPTHLQYLPGGASANEFIHYGQIIDEEADFKQFDFGLWGNIKKYGRTSPPSYDLSRVSAPTYIFYSDNDWLVHQDDALYTASKLPNVPKTIKVANERWNHLDYQMGLDVKTLVNDYVVDILAEYNNK